MTIEVRRYEPSLLGDWSSLLARAKNGLFLFDRAYMDYHADRFRDCSAILYLDGAPAILMPASIDAENHVHSHGGLTFGGFVVDAALRTEKTLAGIDAILAALKEWGAKRLTVRLVPPAFTAYPSSEVDFALWRRGFELVRRDLSSLVDVAAPLPVSKNKARDIARARKLGLTVRDAPLADFFPILSAVLIDRHDTSPVHSLDELALLQRNFPDRLLVRCAYQGERPVAGALLLRYDRVWHTQYLASSDEGKKSSALDLVIAEAIAEAAQSGAPWFSFGSSMDGREVNDGLLWQKESFGARSIVQDVMGGEL